MFTVLKGEESLHVPFLLTFYMNSHIALRREVITFYPYILYELSYYPSSSGYNFLSVVLRRVVVTFQV